MTPLSQSQLNVHIGAAKPASTQVEVELVDGAVETQAVSSSKITHAQEIIAGARGADEQAQKTAVEEAIQHIYPYPPREGQRDALWQLIYQQKDLILIAKTSFGKSMILQAVSILLKKTMTVVILPLDRIGQEQAEYITNIGGRPCFLNADTIN
jgi:superfamily II DNA helicase RecQ